MRNWDGRDDEGMVGGECPADREWADVKAVCASLPGHHPPPVEVNFVREYWTEVFAPFVAAYASGARTPNPDVACNRYIKVGHVQLIIKCSDSFFGALSVVARAFSRSLSNCAAFHDH
jgi:tRNA U34 2-thiouridine synthase MnmA/TrmU